MGFFRRFPGRKENAGEESGPGGGTAANSPRETPVKNDEPPLFNPWQEIRDFRYRFFFKRLINRKSPPVSATEAYRGYIEEITRGRQERRAPEVKQQSKGTE